MARHLLRAGYALVVLMPALAGRTAEPAADKGNPFAAIDKHALDAPAEAEASLAALAKYLVEPCKTEQDKARAVYRWITDRIAYDAEAFFKGKPRDSSPAGVLRQRKAVCEGYSNLYADLAARAGLKVRRVDGFMKSPTISGAHAWNVVEIDGSWRLLDSTCGAGHLAGDKFEKSFSEYYFFTPPASLVFSHLPRDARMQLLDPPLTTREFQAQPAVSAVLFELGVSPKELRAAMAEKGFRDFIRTYNHPGRRTTAVNIPLSRHLRAGTEYTFEIKSEDYDALAFTSEGGLIPLTKSGSTFRATITPRKGRMILGGLPPGTRRYAFILEYSVED